MATAEELLRNTITQPDPEGHIIVNGDRSITIPANLRRLAVQYDHNMETVTFDCPRYWDDRDMSKMAVYINYRLSDGYMDRYPADNVRADGDIMHFDWTISRNVSQVAGNVSFLICIMKTDANGDEERHWNSELCQDAYVSPGMETEESPVDTHPDLITQLLLRMGTVEQINVQADEMQALHDATVEVANTAEETKNQALDASNYIKNSYANAVKGAVSGEIIRVDDVSPIEHQMNLNVHGKNLFNTSKLITLEPAASYAYVSEVSKDHIIITTEAGYDGNGYCTVPIKLREACPGLQVGKTYTLTANTESNSTNMYLPGIQKSWVFGTSKIMTEDILNSTMTFYGLSVLAGMGTGNCRISNIQIEEGSIATAYEPYIDPETVIVNRSGKNLFNINTIRTQGSVTNNGDGTLTVTKSTSQPVETLGQICPALKAGDTATLSFNSANKNQNFIYLVGSKERWDNNSSKTLTQAALDGVIYFYSNKDSNDNGVATRIADIQIELGQTATMYESYIEPMYETPTVDGTCVVTSKSPTMTLFTDTPGVTIEAEYNIDTVKFLNGVITDERINTAVTSWLNAQDSVLIDKTLSQSGRAADAATVGARLTTIDTSIGEIESALDAIIAIQEELIANGGGGNVIYVTYDGTTYEFPISSEMTWRDYIDGAESPSMEHPGQGCCEGETPVFNLSGEDDGWVYFYYNCNNPFQLLNDDKDASPVDINDIVAPGKRYLAW